MIYFPGLNPRTAADRRMNVRRSLLEDAFGGMFPGLAGSNWRSVEALTSFFSSFFERCSGFTSADRRTCLGSRGGSTFPLRIGAGSNRTFRGGNSCVEPLIPVVDFEDEAMTLPVRLASSRFRQTVDESATTENGR